jgi:peroxiredoxin
MHTDPALEMMAMQTAPVGELAPGFRLPNTTGGLSSLADYPGRILVIGLWSPEDSESTIILARLEDVWRKYGSRGVQPIAICISQDRSAAAVFARGSGVDFPVVLDWGTHNADKPSNASPMASAYDADTLPHVVVTDRRRLTRRILKGVDAYEGVGLERAIQERLAAQPD